MPSKKIHKILVANRGEIAVRIISTLKKLSISSVAVYADNDVDSMHCRLADEARPLGGGSLKDTYLNIQKIIDVALDAGVDAIHPGYGFLSEDADFAEACRANNLIFIGPDAESMRLMGDKIRARQFAIENDIPVVWGLVGSVEEIEAQAAALPYPVLIKASAGGGGKGMHIVDDASQLHLSLEQASREAERYFGNGQIFIEQYIRNPRHIEVQILADHHGNVIHLYERECSVQRRYQKIIEESPSPSLSEERRQAICQTAVDICKKMNYNNAGTVEFIVDENQNFYFLEMNTRIQVEHPVTEQRTGIDIVEEQIRIARGKVMGYTQDSIVANGHAIECRIYAEDPENNFMPAPAQLTLYHEPKMRGVIIDSSINGPTVISDSYDPMISKLICQSGMGQGHLGQASRPAGTGLQLVTAFFGVHQHILKGLEVLRERSIAGAVHHVQKLFPGQANAFVIAAVAAVLLEQIFQHKNTSVYSWICQSMGDWPFAVKKALVLEKCLQPKKPL